MTRDDIIRMAREAERYATSQTSDPTDWREIRDERFAALVAAAEREECAKVCEDLSLSRNTDWEAGTLDCAAAIRARGQT